MHNVVEVEPGVFLSPQPGPEELASARQRGIRTVVDLRLPVETLRPNAYLVREFGLEYINLPINQSALCEKLVDELEDVLEQTPGPHLLHCASGARAALLFLVARARRAAWCAEQIFQAAEALGFPLRDCPACARFITRVTSGMS